MVQVQRPSGARAARVAALVLSASAARMSERRVKENCIGDKGKIQLLGEIPEYGFFYSTRSLIVLSINLISGLLQRLFAWRL
jgi:hypothetical protein